MLRDQYWARHGAGGFLTAAAGPAQKSVGTDQLTLGRLLRAAFEALCGVWCVMCDVWCVTGGASRNLKPNPRAQPSTRILISSLIPSPS